MPKPMGKGQVRPKKDATESWRTKLRRVQQRRLEIVKTSAGRLQRIFKKQDQQETQWPLSKDPDRPTSGSTDCNAPVATGDRSETPMLADPSKGSSSPMPVKERQTWPKTKRQLEKDGFKPELQSMDGFIREQFQAVGGNTATVQFDQRNLKPLNNGHGTDPLPRTTVCKVSKRNSLEEIIRMHQAVRSQRRLASPFGPQDATDFVRAWENQLLPKLQTDLEAIAGGYSINVLSGDKPGHRIIDVVTKDTLPQKLTDSFESVKVQCLSEDMNSRTKFDFGTGHVQFCTTGANSQGSSASVGEDPFIQPINVRSYTNFYMGDSIGPCKETSPACDGSATVGPMLKIKDKAYWLLNWHLFDDGGLGTSKFLHWERQHPPNVKAVHPSADDLALDPSKPKHQWLGKAVAYSGAMNRTVRPSKSLQKRCLQDDESHFSQTPQVVTDWILFEADIGARVNKVRRIYEPGRCDSFGNEITDIADPHLPCCCRDKMPAHVYSTGRSSGWWVGQICDVLGAIKFNGVVSRNWSVESSSAKVKGPNDPDWNLGGTGIPGDSGAGIVDLETNKLLGQLWGRNVYRDERNRPRKARVAFFTAMSDILDDIQDRMPSEDRPTLPGKDATDVTVDENRVQGLQSIHENESEMPVIADYGNGSTPGYSPPGVRRSSARATIVARRCGDMVRCVVLPHAATF